MRKMAVTKISAVKKTQTLTAKKFAKQLAAYQSDEELQKIQRYFKTEKGEYGAGDVFMGVRMGDVFRLAKKFAEMPVGELELLLESRVHELRAGAVSIMDKASRDKKITPARLQEFYDLYIRRHDRINNWDLVDLGALHMVGRYLYDKPRKVLYRLAKSKSIWERRTAIIATCYFIRQNDLEDTYKISELLLKDKEDLIHKAVGWMLRYAGDKDHQRLCNFLDRYAATLPRVLLRNCIEKFPKTKREYYMKRSV